MKELFSGSVIADFISEEYNRRLEAKEKYSDRNVIFVSELVRCHHQTIFARAFTEFFSISPSAVLGRFAHIGFQEWLKGRTKNLRVEVELSKVIEGFEVVGRVDAMDDEYIYELKTGLDHKGDKPNDVHLMQVKLYMWLADYQKAKIIYVTHGRFCEYEVTGAYTDIDVLRLIKNWESPRFKWECSYCMYSSICPYRRE